MKRKKLLKTIILVFIFLFCFNINVNAENYAYCYYNYTPGDKDKDFKIFPGGFCLANCDKPASLVLQIAYHETKHPVPRFAGRAILASDADFSDGYQKEFSSDIKYQAITSNNTSSLRFVDLPAVNINQIQNNDGKLMCPNVYLFKETYNSGKPRYQIGLSPDNRSDSGDTYDNYETIKYDSSFSKIHNDSGSSGGSSTEAFSCNYNVMYSSLFQPSGQLGFSVTNEGKVTNIFVTGLLGNTKEYKYEGQQPLTKCPDYLNVEDKMSITSNYLKITEGNSNSYNAVYNGKISSGEDNQKPPTGMKYLQYETSSRNIVLSNVGGNYNVTLIEGKNQKAISISNMGDSEYAEMLSNGNYPYYIIKKKGSDNYEFIDSRKTSDGKYIEYDQLFISSDYLTSLRVDGSSIVETCRGLFGDTFLTFLQDNVFKLIYIGVPILLILLTSFDFAKVVFVDDKEGIQNAYKRLVRRAIVSVLIFLTPTIIIIIANLVGAGESVQECAKTIRSMSGEISEEYEEELTEEN